MKKYVFILMFTFLFACARAENTPGGAAKGFFAALTAGEYTQAADFCADGEAVRQWNPPLFTRLFVYDTVQEIAVAGVQETENGVLVTLAVTAMDMSNEETRYETVNAVMDWLAVDEEDEEALEYALIAQENGCDYTAEYAVPVCVVQKNGVWRVDDAATFALWRGDAPMNVRVVSYGNITYDAPTLKYAAVDGKAPPWNIWLRLESDADEEGLGEFSLENGRCAASLERHYDFYAVGYHAVYQRWHQHNGAYHAVLCMEDLPEAGVLHALRRFNIDALTYVEQAVDIPFENVPYYSGVPENSVQFSIAYYKRIAEEAKLERWGGNALRTIGDWLDRYEIYGEWLWEGLTQEIRDLPVVNDRYALYMLHGTMEKAAGYFGVYDAAFGSSGPEMVPSVLECNMCPVNDLRFFGAESNYLDTAQAGFAIPVLIPLQAGVDPDETLRAMQLQATFSGELIDYTGEHDSATRLGPRTSVPVSLEGMQRWEGSVLDMPEPEETFHWHIDLDGPAEETYEYEEAEDEKGAG